MESPLQSLLNKQKLMISQHKELAEIIFDFETRNKYDIYDLNKKPLGHILERGKGLWHFVKRLLLRSHRPLSIDVLDENRQRALHLHRRFFFIWSDLYVDTPDGRRIGRIHRRFSIIHKKYDLRDAGGNLIATIESPFWRLWAFPLKRHGQQIGVITKKWQGLAKEFLADADSFLVDFGGHPWGREEKLIIFSAAISIDFDHFEDNSMRSSLPFP
ncbi:MAG: phospholipid scramblase-related protein [Bacteriovoracales bacterium]|nr:phospholipid scramblase-related protein [Bacteriovoracales bacterium]